MQQHYHNQQPVVLLSQLPPADDKFKSRSASALLGLSITQIVMGVFCIVLGVVLVAVDYKVPDVGSGMGHIGYGIWIGIILLIIGIIGVRAAKTSNSSLITATMVLNIIFPATGCLIFIGMTSVALVLTSANDCEKTEPYTYDYKVEKGYHWNIDDYSWEYNSEEYYEKRTGYRPVCNYQGLSDLHWAFDSMMLIMALVEFVISIVSAVLCCGALCRCCKQQVGATIQFIARPQQVVVQPALYPSVPNTYPYAMNPVVGIHQPPMYPGTQMSPQWAAHQPTANPAQPPTNIPSQQPTNNYTQQPPSQTLPNMPSAPNLTSTSQGQTPSSSLPPIQQNSSALPPIRTTRLTGPSDDDKIDVPPSYNSLL